MICKQTSFTMNTRVSILKSRRHVSWTGERKVQSLFKHCLTAPLTLFHCKFGVWNSAQCAKGPNIRNWLYRLKYRRFGKFCFISQLFRWKKYRSQDLGPFPLREPPKLENNPFWGWGGVKNLPEGTALCAISLSSWKFYFLSTKSDC